MPVNNGQSGPSSAVGRAVHTRRIAFTFDRSAPSRRHFVAGDIAMSHLVALLSGFFPSGEEFFIQSVRRYDRQIADPVLKKQVAGFIGQEMTHGIQHRELNTQLVHRGYWATGLMDRVGTRLVKRMKQHRDRLPDTVARSALAVTAAVEHLTAILGEQVLSVPWIQHQLTDPEVRAMLNWHAIEEMEHKSVAFDVYRYVGGGERMRITAMALTLGLFLSRSAILLASIVTDPWAWRHPVRTLRSVVALPRTPLFAGLWAKIRCYLRPGFHPDDIDHGPLLEKWRDEYFGPEGILLDHLK
ncbi:metal-dependent hydrolase [Mycobacteroides franklinii]|nr:metal-dependent hydrolase [Mycobacteroides franklinii]